MIKIKIKKKVQEGFFPEFVAPDDNPILKDNYYFIREDDNIFSELEELDVVESEDLFSLLDAIPILKQVKIQRFITGDSFGKIFKLENGEVLKIFEFSRDIDTDIDWYNHLGRKHGTWDSPISKKIYWVLMPYYLPYHEYLQSKGKDYKKTYKEFDNIKNFFEETNSIKLENYLQWLKNKNLNTPTTIELDEIEPILKAIKDVHNFNVDLSDVNAMNIGLEVDKNGKIIKNKFVVFDR